MSPRNQQLNKPNDRHRSSRKAAVYGGSWRLQPRLICTLVVHLRKPDTPAAVKVVLSFGLPRTGQRSLQAKPLCLWSKLLFDPLYNLQNPFTSELGEPQGVYGEHFFELLLVKNRSTKELVLAVRTQNISNHLF